MLSEILWHQPLTFVLFFLSLVTSLVLGEEIVRFSRLGSLCTRAEYITWSLFHNWPWQEVLVFCINSLHRHLDVCGLFENIQQKECWVIPQTVVYSEQRNWKQKQKLLRKKNRELQKKQSKILPEYRRYNRLMAEWSEWNKNKTCIRKRSTEV